MNIREIFLIIIGVTLTTAFPRNEVDKNRTTTQMCLTPGCIHAASSILKNLDASINPCNNFYKFACGKFIKRIIIPADESRIATYTIIRDKLQDKIKIVVDAISYKRNESRPFRLVKQFYKTCMNKNAIEKTALLTFKTILKILGGWPVLEGSSENNVDWKQTVNRLRKWGYSAHYILKVQIETDPKNSSRRLITLDQASLGLNQKYLIKGVQHKVVKAYYNYMVKVAEILGANTTSALEELNESLEFEINIANISLSLEERRNQNDLYNPMTIKELQEKYPSIPWMQYINKVMDGANVHENETIVLKVPQYLDKLEDLLKATPIRVQNNYLMWRAVKESIVYLTEELGHEKLQFDQILRGVMERKHRSKECIEVISNKLDLAIGALYARRYFTEDARKKVREMISDIGNEFRKILEEIDWMDEETRKNALEKAAAMLIYVGYSDELYDNNALEQYYSGLQLSSNDYLLSSLNISLFERAKVIEKLRKPVNKTDWTTRASPAVVNAFYDPTENSIQFPAGMLQGAYFENERPSYLNYGGIGQVIGHEITHGFDDEGKQYDKNGNLVNWWAAETDKAYAQKAQCIVDQYSNYTVSEFNLTLNGVNTQGENIADNGGVKEAYLAYQALVKRNGAEPQLPGLNYTPSQMFWIAAANPYCAKSRPEALKLMILTDPHSPEEFRIRIPFSNLDYFANDFNCPLGSDMNPKQKCHVW